MIEIAKRILNKVSKGKVNTNEEFYFSEIAQTNLLIAKNKLGNIGFIIFNDDNQYINKKNNLEKFTFQFKSKLETPQGTKTFINCTIIISNEPIDENIFVSVVIALFNKKEIKKVTTELLIIKLKEVLNIFNYLSSSKSELIGIWGELFFISYLINIYKSKNTIISEIIDSWEGENARTAVDFKFKTLKIAFEVKTTKSESRIHHINGYEQINYPTGINNFYYLSLTTNENGNTSCLDLYSNILKNLNTKKLQSAFIEKCYLRGIKQYFSLSNSLS